MGTPEFAVASLDALRSDGQEIAAVVTAPDKPAGRGRQVQPSAVKAYAQAQGLTLLQPERLKSPAFLDALRALEPDLAVVVAFRMLPEAVWRIPRLGTFNLHASLLPDYRGAAPINWAIINGETRSGATTFLIDREIDTGSLLLQEAVDIPLHWNAGDLHDALMTLGARLVVETVHGLGAGTLAARPQDAALFQHPAPKLFPEDGCIRWEQPAEQVYNRIRGLSPYPAAWTRLDGKLFKVYAASRTGLAAGAAPGTLQPERDRLLAHCADEWLQLDSVQLEGKKRMSAAEFLRGIKQLPSVFG